MIKIEIKNFKYHRPLKINSSIFLFDV